MIFHRLVILDFEIVHKENKKIKEEQLTMWEELGFESDLCNGKMIYICGFKIFAYRAKFSTTFLHSCGSRLCRFTHYLKMS